jgi:ParB family transcriptional regulator, chromosome partitioning protein
MSETHLFITIDDIIIPDGRRATDAAAVRRLAESIKQVGLRHPITVTKRGDKYTLVTGLHRIEAYKKLGHEHIPAVITKLSKLEAELWEIDENLCRSELGPAEEASALRRRKAIYEELHPATKHGGDHKSAEAKSTRQNGDLKSFAGDTADNTGMSERTVQRTVERAVKIGDDNLRKITGTSLDKPGELDALCDLPEKTRNSLIERAASGERVSAKVETHGRKARGSKPKPAVAEPEVEPLNPKADTVTGDEPDDDDDTVITPEEHVALLSDYYKLVDRNSVLTAALNTKEIEAGRTWPPDMNKKQLKKRDRYLESISYFQLELERLYAEVTKQPSWRAEIITKSGERLVNGARFATRGEVDAHANAYARHLSKEGQGKIEVEVIPCEDDEPNAQLQGTTVHFAHGDCVLLDWRPAQANEHPAAETGDISTSPTTGTTAVPPA